MTRRFTVTLAFAALTAGWTPGPATADEIVVPLTNPTGQVVVEVSLIEGDIEVQGHDGAEVLLMTEEEEDHDEEYERHGLRRIPRRSFGLTVEEENNRVRVSADGGSGDGVRLRVPRRSTLLLSTINDGDIDVRGVTGQHELNNTNGDIMARDVGGSVVAHTVNGDITVALKSIEAGRPMSFSTLNGDIDVSLPANAKASLSMRSDQGEIFTDFDVELSRQSPRTDRARVGNRYRVEVHQDVAGTINGGGPEIQFRTYHGDILIRKLFQ